MLLGILRCSHHIAKLSLAPASRRLSRPPILIRRRRTTELLLCPVYLPQDTGRAADFKHWTDRMMLADELQYTFRLPLALQFVVNIIITLKIQGIIRSIPYLTIMARDSMTFDTV